MINGSLLSVEHAVVPITVHYGLGSLVTNGITSLEELTFFKPDKSACLGKEHIPQKYDFKYKEQNSTQYLTVEYVTKSENDKGKLNGPITLNKCISNILDLSGQELAKAKEKLPDRFAEIFEPKRKTTKYEQLDVVQEPCKTA